VTIDSGAFVTVTRPNITKGLHERELSGQYILQAVLGETLRALKVALVEMNRTEHFTNLGVHRKYHRGVFPGTGCLTSVQGNGRFETPCATTGRSSSVIMASGSITRIIFQYNDQRQFNTGSMWDSSDFAAGELS
jgi:hypothetical protein